MDPVWERAVTHGEVETVRTLLRSGADINARDGHGQTGLMLAAHQGRLETCEVLVAHGADVNVIAKHGLNALMLAIVAGHVPVARLLARAGTDLTVEGVGAPGFAAKTAYDLAVARGMHELYGDLNPT
jgi:ankyrin repeat protein